MYDYFVFPVNFHDIEEPSPTMNRHRVILLTFRSSWQMSPVQIEISFANLKISILPSMIITKSSQMLTLSIFSIRLSGIFVVIGRVFEDNIEAKSVKVL